MTKARKIFAVHPGEILKTEFMEPMGVTAYALARRSSSRIYEVVRGDRAISAETAIRLGKYFGLPAQFWLNLQNDYDLRIAGGGGIARGIKPRIGSRDELSASTETCLPAQSGLPRSRHLRVSAPLQPRPLVDASHLTRLSFLFGPTPRRLRGAGAEL